jgi:aromatic-amino-acid transaminase
VAYNQAVQSLLFGADSPVLKAQRVVTIEALGGTGALKVGADYLRRLLPQAKVAISDPSWENHRALFEMAGFEVLTYRYYDPSTRGVDAKGMLESLQALPKGTILVLHACCHNPTGVDLSAEQWSSVIAAIQASGHIPFLDMAYQGFGEGIAQDAAVLNAFLASGMSFLVSSSFSKSFSLYGERVGALSIVTQSADEASRVLSQVKRTIRTNYSNPPTHGGAVVAMVLSTPALRATWEAELAEMRDRIKTMRKGLADGLKARGFKGDVGFITSQRGMFSYTGLSGEQVDRLQEEFGVYAVGTGRICIAALNSQNLERVCDAIAAVSS